MEKEVVIDDVLVQIVKDLAETGNVMFKMMGDKSPLEKGMILLTLSDEVSRLLAMKPLEVKQKFVNLDEKQIDHLNTIFDHKFDIKNDIIEEIIEKGLDALIAIGDAVADIIDLSQKVAAK